MGQNSLILKKTVKILSSDTNNWIERWPPHKMKFRIGRNEKKTETEIFQPETNYNHHDISYRYDSKLTLP